jgi:ligand-binding sensor protein
MTSNGGTVIVNSGSGNPFIQTVQAGVQTFEVPMQVGEQRFQLLTNAGLSAGGSSNVTVTDSCWVSPTA